MMTLPSFNTWLEHNAGDIRALCLDIDGVLIKSGRRLPGARRLMDLLEYRALPFFLLTNDGNHSTEEKAERLNRAGLSSILPGHIVSCGHAIKPLVDAMNLAGAMFFVMGDTGKPCYAEAAGLKVTRRLEHLGSCHGVIIGEENYNWEPVINAVTNFFIDHPRAPLVVPNPDEFYPASDLKIHIAAGGVARLIQHVLREYGVNITPVYLGKPHPPIFKLARQRLAQEWEMAPDPEKVLMVGDNLSADIIGGRNMGHRTALLLTGVTMPSAVNGAKVLPDMVFERL